MNLQNTDSITKGKVSRVLELLNVEPRDVDVTPEGEVVLFFLPDVEIRFGTGTGFFKEQRVVEFSSKENIEEFHYEEEIEIPEWFKESVRWL